MAENAQSSTTALTGHPRVKGSAFSGEMVDLLAECLRRGMPVKSACGYAGISKTTFYTWHRRGEAGEEPFATFVEVVRRAQGERVRTLIDGVDEIANDPNHKRRLDALTWQLERVHGLDPRRRVELTGAEGGPVQTESHVTSALDPEAVAAMSLEQLEAAMRALAGKEER